jgi:hypothetical protein
MAIVCIHFAKIGSEPHLSRWAQLKQDLTGTHDVIVIEHPKTPEATDPEPMSMLFVSIDGFERYAIEIASSKVAATCAGFNGFAAEKSAKSDRLTLPCPPAVSMAA